MFIIPISLEAATLRRLPLVSIGIALICVAAFLATWLPLRAQIEDAATAIKEVTSYYAEHPYLEAPPELATYHVMLGLPAPDQPGSRGLVAEALGVAVEAEPELAQDRVAEQEYLAYLAESAKGAIEGVRFYSLSLNPTQLRPWTFITYMFLHAGWLHLIFNLVFLYVSGLLLEDRWGRPFYAGFYLVAGVVAALIHLMVAGWSGPMLVGASGAIAGTMGAMTVRMPTERVVYFYFIMFRWGTLVGPAWALIPFWFAGEVLMGVATLDSMQSGGTAHWAHIGGFVFGMAIAALVRVTGLEERWLSPD